MKRNKFKTILSVVRPVGAAEQMLPDITPADLIGLRTNHTTLIPKGNEPTSPICAPMGKRVVPRNRNILSSTKLIR